MSRGCERTIGLRTPTKRCDEESAKCSGSSQLDPPSASSASMPPSTTHSIFNDTLSPDQHCGRCERKQRRSGKGPSQRYEIWFAMPSLGSSIVAMTRPFTHELPGQGFAEPQVIAPQHD